MSFLVPAILGGLALSVMALVSIAAARKGKHPSPVHQAPAQLDQPRILVHSINEDRCVGCDACVAVCPTNVLDLVSNKSRVMNFQDCIQCEACMWACPTDALVMHLEGTEPPTLKVPELDENYQTVVPGQYLIGEVAGKPLVKNAANLGRAVIEHALKNGLQPNPASADGMVDVAIVGSGPGGLSAALACIRHGLSYVVLEKEQIIASTVSRYPKGKYVMAEPYDTRNLSFLPVFDSTKEEIVPVWQEMVDKAGINIKMGEPVESVTKREDGNFDVRTTVASYSARRVVLAIGTRGKPRTLGVPGENLPKVRSLLEDPDEFRGQAVLVIGGGDSAVEAAMALADSGARVLLSYRGKSFSRAQKKNQAAIESYAAQKRVKTLYQSQVLQFTDDTVTLAMGDGQQKSYPNNAAFVLIGADPPVKWLAKVGVHVVDRPHSYALGKTDEMVEKLASGEVIECPEDTTLAVTLAREGRLPMGAMQAQMQPVVSEGFDNKTMIQPFEPVSGARKWLRTATTMFTSAFRIDQPMPLGDFAQRKSRRIHTGQGRRDALSKSERTRVLRMLRDEGGRLADEDTRMLKMNEVSLPPPPAYLQQSSPPPQPQAASFYQQTQMAPGYQPQAPAASPYQQTQMALPHQQTQMAPPHQQTQMAPPPAQRPLPGAPPVVQMPLSAQAPPARPPQPSKTLFAHGALPSQPHRSSPRRFDEEPTRQVDGDAALAKLLDERSSSGGRLGEDSMDAAATQAVSQRYNDPLTVGSDEETRIGYLGEMQPGTYDDNSDEPTRAADISALLGGNRGASGQGRPGAGNRPLDANSAPTRALDLSQLARERGVPPPDEAPTRALDLRKQNLPPDPYRKPK